MNLKHIEKTFVRQHDASDFGVACLLSIINYFEGQNTLENLRRISGTTKVGTTLLGLVQSAKKIGFSSQGASGNMEELLKQKHPVILHVKTDQGLLHYVVFYGVIEERCIVGDSAQGVTEYNLKELDKLWASKHCLIHQECTGSPEEFAVKLKVNRSHLYRLIDYMKDHGAPIIYNRKLLSFCYNKPFNLHSISPFKELSVIDMEFTRGGGSIFASVSFYETEGLYF